LRILPRGSGHTNPVRTAPFDLVRVMNLPEKSLALLQESLPISTINLSETVLRKITGFVARRGR
jgi:hypothetical protein